MARFALADLGLEREASGGGDLFVTGQARTDDHRIARRIAELECAQDTLRGANRALELGKVEDEKKRRALRARLARQEKQAGGSDTEYLRNVLLRFFILPVSERSNLFPAIAAACAFSPKELADINRARDAHANAGSSWLWRRESSANAEFGDGPPGTPLAAPPPRTPTTGAAPAATDDDLAAMRDKIAKLRWLLWSANNEIQRLKTSGAAEDATPGTSTSKAK